MSTTRLKKYQTIPFLNTATSANPTWARIGMSTIFDLVLNAQVETNDFISYEMPVDDVTYYKPELAQELQTNKGDDAFDEIYSMFQSLPTGEDVKKELLLVFAGNTGTDLAPTYFAWKCNATLILDHFDTVAEKIYFKFSIYEKTAGSVSITGGVPSFTPAS